MAQACRELGIEMRSVGAVDQDAEAVTVYRRHNATRTVSTASVSTLVDYRVRGMGADCRFQYEPEMVEPAFEALAGHVDVVLAGPPCQGHSNLNNKTRRTDKRNELYLTAPAIGIALGAPVIIIENVQAAIHDRKQVVQSTLALLENAGYHITHGLLKAAELGWPQRRDRFFIIARRDRAPVPIEQMTAAFRRPEPRDIWWAIGELEDAPQDEFMNLRPKFSDENLRRIDWLFDNDEHDLDLAQRPDCHKEGTTYNAVYGRLHKERPAPTITTGYLTPGRGRYIHPTRRRVLTPREAARLQGFPDTYDFRLGGGEIPPKVKLGKWIGDAVPMPLGYIAGLAALGPGRA
jgi:DNA (cytosine-5)-methyltransferase 1